MFIILAPSRQGAKKTCKALHQDRLLPLRFHLSFCLRWAAVAHSTEFVLCDSLAPLRLCARLISFVFFSNALRISGFSRLKRLVGAPALSNDSQVSRIGNPELVL
jgi:hypothetical protein